MQSTNDGPPGRWARQWWIRWNTFCNKFSVSLREGFVKILYVRHGIRVKQSADGIREDLQDI